MQNHSKIESFFSLLNFSWQDLIEFLPVGVIFFDENWNIKSVNRNFADFFEDEWIDIKLEGINLFSKNILSEKLPLKEVLLLKEGKHFEKLIPFERDNDKDLNLLFKGSPIFKDGIFQGGTLIVEDYRLSETATPSLLPSSSSVTNFLNKICKCFLIVDLEGIIQIVSGDNQSRCKILKNSEGENISDLFSSDAIEPIESLLKNVISQIKSQSMELNYFSNREIINFNSVFIPFTDNNNEVNTVVVLLKERDSVSEDAISYLNNSIKLKEFESFATISADGLFKINLHGNVTYWTENASKLFGISEYEILSKFIGRIFPEITQEYLEEIRKKILTNGIWEGYLTSNENHDNSIIRVKIISKVYDNETDLYVYCNKINKQQQKIISAREEEKLFFKDAVIKSNQMILQANPNGTILFTNEKFGEKFDYELDEIRGALFIDLIEKKFKIKHKLTNFETLLIKKELEVLPLVSKTGQIVEVCFDINLSTSNSELQYFTIYFRECSLKDNIFLETAHALLYQFTEPVVIVSDDKIIKVNPRFCELFGSEFEADYFDVPIEKIVDPTSKNSLKNLLKSNSVSNSVDKISFTKDNNTRFEANVKKICCSKDFSFSVFIIQPLVEEEDMVVNKTKKIKKHFGEANSYTWSGFYENNKLKIDFIEPDFIKRLGYSQIDFIFQPNFLEEITHPDDIDKIQDQLTQLFYEQNETPKEITYRVINKEGDVVWINNRIKINIHDQEKALNIYGSITDVTDWTLEREELKSIISELDKLNTAKEKFISIISHDLKSPFTSIVGFSELILTDPNLEKKKL